jgi:hypothetical protein
VAGSDASLLQGIYPAVAPVLGNALEVALPRGDSRYFCSAAYIKRDCPELPPRHGA